MVQAHTDEVTGLVFYKGSDLAATCSRDCSLKVWRISTGAFWPALNPASWFYHGVVLCCFC